MGNEGELLAELEQLGDPRSLARAAWRSAPPGALGDIMRQSMRSIAHDDPTTMAALADEGAAFGSVLELHLANDMQPRHSVLADKFADFVNGLAQAVKETSKHTLNRQRYANPLLVTGISIGSVKVSVATPPARLVSGSTPLNDTFVDDVDAKSLAQVTAVLAQASLDDDAVIEALATALPMRARAGLRRASVAIVENNWDVDATFSRPGRKTEALHFDTAGARRITRALSSAHKTSRHIEVSGRIDGNRRSLLVMYFEPDSGRPFAAAVPDPGLYEQVVAMDAPDARILAKFRVDDTIAAGDETVVRRTYTLESLRAFEQVATFDVDFEPEQFN